MITFYMYRIYCETDEKFEYKWAQSPISTCPIDVLHNVRENTTSYINFKDFNLEQTISNNDNVIKSGLYNCDSSSSDIVISLPYVGINIGIYFYFEKTSAINTVTIVGYNGELIDNNLNFILNDLSDSVMISSENGINWVTNPENIPISEFNIQNNNSSYSAVVSNDQHNPGKYKSIAEAFNNGEINVFVKSGVYIESNEIIIPNGGKLTGEHFGNVYIVGGRIRVDGSGGVKETAGTISILHGETEVIGNGTTFTNLSPGYEILIANNFLTILSIIDDTHLIISVVYQGINIENSAYIAQNILTGVEISNFIIVNSPGVGLYIRAVKCSVFHHITSMKSASHNIIVEDSADSAFKTIVAADGYADGILCSTSFDILFETCNVYNNTENGLECKGKCIFVVFDKCSSSCNNINGIRIIDECSEITILNSLTKSNNNSGIYIDQYIKNAVISSCICHNNNGNGLEILSNECSISSIVSRQNTSNGIYVVGNAHLTGNVCNNNNGHGMYIKGDISNINSNTVKSNLGDGFYIEGSYSTINGNISSNNENGINILANSNENTVTSNQFSLNKSNNFINNGTNNGISNNKF